MMRTQNISRLLVTCMVLAAFLFGQAAALEHAALHGGQVHAVADHADGDNDNDSNSDDTLCDLSLFAAAESVCVNDPGGVIGSVTATLFTFNPLATAFVGGVKILGPPSRGPPLSPKA
ncbi:MAG: hypothetical protein ACPG06_09240 [Alphaproteobacteria bacterium]